MGEEKKALLLWEIMLNQHLPPSLFIYHHSDEKMLKGCRQKWQKRSFFFPADMFPDCCKGSFWNVEPAATIAASTASLATQEFKLPPNSIRKEAMVTFSLSSAAGFQVLFIWLLLIFTRSSFIFRRRLFLKTEGESWQDLYLFLEGRVLCMDSHLLNCSVNSSQTGSECKQKGQGKHCSML